MSERQDGAAVSGPYIVEAKVKDWTDHRAGLTILARHHILSRVAVGSLEEAKRRLSRAFYENQGEFRIGDGEVYMAIDAIPASGGSVDLPDGTRIEVRGTTWHALAEQAYPDAPSGGRYAAGRWASEDGRDAGYLLADWNAEHGR